MSKKAVVPDAWDDDWEAQADNEEIEAEKTRKIEAEPKSSKAERLAKHAETNKKIWKSAEEPETFHFLAARDNVPLKSEFKPALKVLSRKPAPKVVQRVDPLTGLAKMVLDDEDDDPEQTKALPTPEELRRRAQKEREEKQRKYDEARARIMGTSSLSGTSSPKNVKSISGNSSPRTATPPIESLSVSRGKGELFDPSSTAISGVSTPRGFRSGRSTPRDEDQIIRAPRGPDGSGRGGFGFANRGGKTS